MIFEHRKHRFFAQACGRNQRFFLAPYVKCQDVLKYALPTSFDEATVSGYESFVEWYNIRNILRDSKESYAVSSEKLDSENVELPLRINLDNFSFTTYL